MCARAWGSVCEARVCLANRAVGVQVQLYGRERESGGKCAAGGDSKWVGDSGWVLGKKCSWQVPDPQVEDRAARLEFQSPVGCLSGYSHQGREDKGQRDLSAAGSPTPGGGRAARRLS